MAESFERLYRAYGRFVTGFAVLAGLIIFAIMWLVDVQTSRRRQLLSFAHHAEGEGMGAG